ncbi:uncharacterized protein LOC114874523 [Osmia bicornis bicornis]|uniref:uncharacterized protein LOC114874523 n=1 Tax=Osmia bicornis bicornis TaxID=1437191 RepID=UPI001EAF84BB|nr:uncharacterized protein LOC114874523 [Osmia bicornis bicornis]
MAAIIQFLLLLCVSALFTSGFAETIDVEEDEVVYRSMTNISSIVDLMLPKLREYILNKGMDPLKLNNIYQQLPGVVIRNRVINLTNGRLQGLSSINRVGDTILISNNSGVYTVIATLGFDVIDGTYDYLFKDFLINRRGLITGRFVDINVKVVADVNFRNREVVLRTVNIVKVGELSITFKGHNIIDSVVNLILKHVTNRFRDTILSAVEKQLVGIAQQYVDKLLNNLPLSEEFMVNNDILKSIPTSVNIITDDSFSTYELEQEKFV